MNKKQTTEEKYAVDMRKAGPSGLKSNKTVNAIDSQAALRKAKQGDPTNYDNIKVKKDTGTVRPNANMKAKTKPNTVPATGLSETKKKTRKRTSKKPSTTTDSNSFEIVKGFKSESFTYPYCIILPESFRSVLTDVVSLKKTNITETKSKGKVSIVIEDSNSMDVFMNKMVKFYNGRDTRNKELSKNIINGIMRSIG